MDLVWCTPNHDMHMTDGELNLYLFPERMDRHETEENAM